MTMMVADVQELLIGGATKREIVKQLMATYLCTKTEAEQAYEQGKVE